MYLNTVKKTMHSVKYEKIVLNFMKMEVMGTLITLICKVDYIII
jgi:hypothetical protein